MDISKVIDMIKEISDERAVKIWEKIGLDTEKYLGAGLTNLRKLGKKIGRTRELANSLWETDIHDAKLLACFIDEPKKITIDDIKRYSNNVLFWDLSDKFCSEVIAKTKFSEDLATEWLDDKNEFKRRSSYVLISGLAKKKKHDNDFFINWLNIAEKKIDKETNWVREGILYMLIAVGKVNDELKEKVLQLSTRIGKIEIDYGDTSCKAPDIEKSLK